MQRIVLDPNVLASALIGGFTRRRFDWLLANLDRFEICYCDRVIEEIISLADVEYFKKKNITRNKIAEFADNFQSYALKIIVTSKVKVGRDRNDYYLLSLSRDSRAKFLLTGDPDLLEVGIYGSTRIVSMKEFLEIFR